jgi:signal transduction histidine kinase
VTLSTRVTLWYTLLLAVVLAVLGVLMFGTLTRWIEAESMNQLGQQARDVRVALIAAAQTGEPFSISATRVLNEVLGRDVQGSVWAADGHLIARSDGFYFPQEITKPAGEAVAARYVNWNLPAQPSLASSDAIGQLSDKLFVNVEVAGGTVASTGQNRVAMLLFSLEGVPDDLVATPDAYPDVPPLVLPAMPNGGPRRAVIALTTSFDREAASITSVLVVMAAAGILILGSAAYIARRIVRHGLRAIDAMASASQRLAEGDLSTRVPVPGGSDEIARLASAFNDMAVQLDSAFTAQRAFVADASHELRTPLAALRGQVDVMRRAISEQPADADRLATSMRRELARLSRLVEDLLVLARLDALGRAALSPRSVDVCSVAEDVYAQVTALPAARDRDVRLERNGAVRIIADGERLHQVLLNLLANAVEHTPPGGCATLSVMPSRDGAYVEVRDTGAGIPSDHLARIFDRFYRADGTRHGGGAGLGLAIARAIVEAHGGRIVAANRAEGGASFTVEIPTWWSWSATCAGHELDKGS